VPVLEINLYDLMIGLLREAGTLGCAGRHSSVTSQRIRRPQGAAKHPQPASEVLIPSASGSGPPGSPFRVLFLTGVGEVFPVIRSHLILNNLQSVLKDAPTIIFFPGRYAHGFANGSSLQVLCRLEEDHYYRAHNLLHMREAT
jgi:hypothetical protein